MKAETPVTSDVEAALDEAAKEYVSLLVGLINALPKQKRQAESGTARQEDEAEELAAGMEPSAQGMSVTKGFCHLDGACSQVLAKKLLLRSCWRAAAAENTCLRILNLLLNDHVGLVCA